MEKFNIRIALFSLIVIVILGTFGYHVIEGTDILLSLYMTVITLATVGFREVIDLSRAGMIFTIILIISGVSTVAYVMACITQILVEGELAKFMGRKKLEKKIAKIKDHYIVCGYGRMGSLICHQLALEGKSVISIEKDPEALEMIDKDGYSYIDGDATDEDSLFKANISSARGLIATTSSDADNLFIVMTARVISPSLFILSRAVEEKTEKKLLRAGADRVVSPYYIGGMRMSQAILKPNVCDFFDLVNYSMELDLIMEEVTVSNGAGIVGETLKESKVRQNYDVIILGIKRSSGEFVFNPGFEEKFASGDTLIIMGSREMTQKLKNDVS